MQTHAQENEHIVASQLKAARVQTGAQLAALRICRGRRRSKVKTCLRPKARSIGRVRGVDRSRQSCRAERSLKRTAIEHKPGIIDCRHSASYQDRRAAMPVLNNLLSRKSRVQAPTHARDKHVKHKLPNPLADDLAVLSRCVRLKLRHQTPIQRERYHKRNAIGQQLRPNHAVQPEYRVH